MPRDFSQTLQRADTTEVLSLNTIAGAKILMAENNEINKEFALELLRSEGLIVDHAYDGLEAIKKVQSNHYDAILMDMQMPNLDGIEATKRIRKLSDILEEKHYKDIPIIGLSANAMQNDLDSGREAGMNDYLTKPINPDQLFQSLLRWIAPKQREMVLEDQTKATEEYDFSLIQGIDIEAALERVLDNQSLFINLLKKFHTKHDQDIDEITKLINDSHFDEASQICHTLKGICGHFSHDGLFTHLQTLETMLKSSQMPSQESLDHLKTDFKTFQDSIESFLQSVPE